MHVPPDLLSRVAAEAGSEVEHEVAANCKNLSESHPKHCAHRKVQYACKQKNLVYCHRMPWPVVYHCFQVQDGKDTTIALILLDSQCKQIQLLKHEVVEYT